MFEARSICVVGLGYIGLPTASLLATKGYSVHGVDVNAHVVDTINAGGIHISEPELDTLVRSAVQSGNLKASLDPEPADVFVLAVPTPFKDGYVPDLRFVEDATRKVAGSLRKGNLLILESTSPVGTTAAVVRWVREERPDLSDGDLFIAHCPERVLPGQIIKELVTNDRIVGGIDDVSTEAAADFYRSFVTGEVLTTSARTAELAKLTENTFRDVNIALANELSLICDQLAVNVWDLIRLVNHHPRVNVLQPGPGVGGHCIAVDPWFIVDSAPEIARLIRTAREVNDAKPQWVVDRVRMRAERMKSPVIACMGIAYKADVDDLRESPALRIAEKLTESRLGDVIIVEPYIRELPDRLAGLGAVLVTQEEAIKRADIIVGLVDHRVFRRISPADMAEKVVVDTRGMWH